MLARENTMTHRLALTSALMILGLTAVPACKLKSTNDAPPIPTAGCQPWDCGGFPEGANVMCADGVTQSGPTGSCIAHGTECAWEVVSCPETPECEPADCGAPVPGVNYLCNDNTTISGPSGRCIGYGASCHWEVLSCPAHADYCPVSACGEALQLPNWVCPDGHTIAGPTGDCVEAGNNTCAWEVVKCGTSVLH